MKIRITGTLAELSEAGARLAEVFELREVSEPYQNRGGSQLYRLYVEAALPTDGSPAGGVPARRADSERLDRPPRRLPRGC